MLLLEEKSTPLKSIDFDFISPKKVANNRLFAVGIQKKCFYCVLPCISIFVVFIFLFIFPEDNYFLFPRKKDIPSFHHLKPTKNIDCGLVFENSHKGATYRKHLSANRVLYADDDSIKTDCNSIHSRGYYPVFPLSKSEKHFPIAFAKIVYKDYYFLESQLRIEYAPQNSFCFLLDSKSDVLFKQRMRNLASCFDNVLVPDEELDVHSFGHNMTIGHLTCLRHLQHRQWKYVILLQNHDVILKTNAEIVSIFETFNGANDVSACKPANHTFSLKANWTIDSLKLFKNENLNQLYGTTKLKITKSLVQVSLSRAAVDYVLDELNVENLIQQLELKTFGVDELFWATLNANEVVNLPGGFTRECLDDKNPTYMATRFTLWLGNRKPLIPCRTNFYRRWVCLFGIEDLPNLIHVHHIYVNKLLPNYDFGAVTCLLERVYNNTYSKTPKKRLKLDIYADLPHVRYQAFKNNDTAGNHPFNCTESSDFISESKYSEPQYLQQ